MKTCRLPSPPRSPTGLAAGHITMLVFGDDTKDFFLVIGQAVDDVRMAQNMAQMNEVILSPNCWQLCDRSMIEIERIPDQRAVKVSVLLQKSCRAVPGFVCQKRYWGDWFQDITGRRLEEVNLG